MENRLNIIKADDKQTDVTIDTKSSDAPFVNEECGDTMWEDVLKEAEERLSNIVTQKPGNDNRESS